jgi:hypothetical protein
VNETDWRIYYDAFGPAGRFTCVAVSTDGTTYTKPGLGLVMFENSTDNNIIGVVGTGPTVKPTPLGHSQWGAVFIDRNPTTPLSERFKIVGHDVYGSSDGFS